MVHEAALPKPKQHGMRAAKVRREEMQKYAEAAAAGKDTPTAWFFLVGYWFLTWYKNLCNEEFKLQVFSAESDWTSSTHISTSLSISRLGGEWDWCVAAFSQLWETTGREIIDFFSYYQTQTLERLFKLYSFPLFERISHLRLHLAKKHKRWDNKCFTLQKKSGSLRTR